jgi:hypothetical protein
MRVYTADKKIVKLKEFRFCWNSYALLMTIQYQTPNLLLEVEGPGPQREFVPAHALSLENFHALSLLNA